MTDTPVPGAGEPGATAAPVVAAPPVDAAAAPVEAAAPMDTTAPEGPDAEAAPPTPTPHDFGELPATAPGGGGGSLNMLYDLMMPVSVELGRTAMTVREVLDLTRGSVVPLNRLAGEPIDIYVSDRKLAEGEVVVLGEHFGVRLTRIVSSGAATAAAGAQQQASNG